MEWYIYSKKNNESLLSLPIQFLVASFIDKIITSYSIRHSFIYRSALNWITRVINLWLKIFTCVLRKFLVFWEGGRLWEVVDYGRWSHVEVRLYNIMIYFMYIFGLRQLNASSVTEYTTWSAIILFVQAGTSGHFPYNFTLNNSNHVFGYQTCYQRILQILQSVFCRNQEKVYFGGSFTIVLLLRKLELLIRLGIK